MPEFLLAHWFQLLDGAATTIKLTFSSVIIGATLSLPIAVMYRSGHKLVRSVIRVYISFFRGTPLLAQLFLVYYGSGQFRHELSNLGLWWFFREPMCCALLAFVMNTCAYQSEILRGGLQGVSPGEVEAGRAIGMSSFLLYRKIILPHTYRIAFPALGNEVILMLKGSAIASIITIFDLMGETRRVFAETFDIAVYFWVALIYLLITSSFVLGWGLIERRLKRHVRQRATVGSAVAFVKTHQHQ